MARGILQYTGREIPRETPPRDNKRDTPTIEMEKGLTFVSKHDRQSLLEVRGRYGTLSSMIEQLSTKLTSVSTHIEEEFLSAYRVHMLSVQQELRDLKLQVVKAEDALNEDKQVAQLEHEVVWFSDETMRLKNQAASMKKDMQHVVMRTKALREQRLFLGEQLKSTLKRSRILEAELLELGDRGQLEGASVASPKVMQESASAPFLTRPAQSLRLATSKSTPKFPSLLKKKMLQKSAACATAVSDDVLIPKKVVTEGSSFLLSPVEELDQLKKQRQTIEKNLENVIRGVLREIIDRKVNAAARDMRCSVEEAQSKPKFFDMGGLTGLGLDHFSDSDRLSAISIFLSSPSVFKQVSEFLRENVVVD